MEHHKKEHNGVLIVNTSWKCVFLREKSPFNNFISLSPCMTHPFQSPSHYYRDQWSLYALSYYSPFYSLWSRSIKFIWLCNIWMDFGSLLLLYSHRENPMCYFVMLIELLRWDFNRRRHYIESCIVGGSRLSFKCPHCLRIITFSLNKVFANYMPCHS